MFVETVMVVISIGKIALILVEQEMLPTGLFWWIIHVSIFTVIVTVDDSRYWSFGYLAGVAVVFSSRCPSFWKRGFSDRLTCKSTGELPPDDHLLRGNYTFGIFSDYCVGMNNYLTAFIMSCTFHYL